MNIYERLEKYAFFAAADEASGFGPQLTQLSDDSVVCFGPFLVAPAGTSERTVNREHWDPDTRYVRVDLDPDNEEFSPAMAVEAIPFDGTDRDWPEWHEEWFATLAVLKKWPGDLVDFEDEPDEDDELEGDEEPDDEALDDDISRQKERVIATFSDPACTTSRLMYHLDDLETLMNQSETETLLDFVLQLMDMQNSTTWPHQVPREVAEVERYYSDMPEELDPFLLHGLFCVDGVVLHEYDPTGDTFEAHSWRYVKSLVEDYEAEVVELSQ